MNLLRNWWHAIVMLWYRIAPPRIATVEDHNRDVTDWTWPKGLPELIITVGSWPAHLEFCDKRGIWPSDRKTIRNVGEGNILTLRGLAGPIVVYWLPGYDAMSMRALNEIRSAIRAIEETTMSSQRRHFYVDA